MSRVVLLDTGPLSMASNPKASPETQRCRAWMDSLLAGGVLVKVPEIADYELRRELLRANRLAGIARLDALIARIGYLPITTTAMRKAAEFWAKARQQGTPTAADKALDGDMILSGQAAAAIANGEAVEIATTNVGHLSLFVPARMWNHIS